MTNTFIKIGGVSFPYPDYTSGLQTQSTSVDGVYNINNVFIGQKLGRDKSKVDLAWSIMEAPKWAQLLSLFDKNFTNNVEYYDMAKGKIVSRKMYVDDRTARPYKVDDSTGCWLIARDCSLSLVDTGKGD